jgi:hypothetical protein
MSRTLIVSVVTLAATTVILSQDFKSGTEIVTVPVSVTKRGGAEHVGGLTVDQFRLFEDGVEQDVTAFSSDRRPISLVVALDSSSPGASQSLSFAIGRIPWPRR